MKRTKSELWQRFQQHCSEYPSLGLTFDLNRVDFPDDLFQKNQARIQSAFRFMAELESGAIANPDEKRMVGHYWLRNTAIAPNKENIRQDIEKTLKDIKEFAAAVHSGKVQGAGGPFKNLLVVGIGGSALGPQFVASALGNPLSDKLTAHFFDNTDPDGMDRVLAKLSGYLNRTLVLVISKSGGTKETRNGMLEAQIAYERIGLDFGAHAVAVTGIDSELDKYASKHNWLKRFPMWDWVGGRTSETSVVGLLPAALQGLDIDGFLAGAKACDEVTRVADVNKNPAAKMALVVDYIGKEKAMVVLPYKDRLELFSKYLQQLVMESLGKELDLHGKVVNQGLTVYGNKGSTDQHAYIQQLREGPNNFFAVFIEVLKDRFSNANNLLMENEATSGDYLQGFFLGTRSALYENGRKSMTITITEVSAFSVGVLVALFERFVGLYAQLIGINAYHQPGVQAGKLAADDVLMIQSEVLKLLRGNPGKEFSSDEMAPVVAKAVEQKKSAKAKKEVKVDPDPETVFKICEHLVMNGRGVGRKAGATPFASKYCWCG